MVCDAKKATDISVVIGQMMCTKDIECQSCYRSTILSPLKLGHQMGPRKQPSAEKVIYEVLLYPRTCCEQ